MLFIVSLWILSESVNSLLNLKSSFCHSDALSDHSNTKLCFPISCFLLPVVIAVSALNICSVMKATKGHVATLNTEF